MKFKFKLLEELSNEYDNEGNQLTREQAEFFRDSKVRDEQGRLLVCYHSTNAEFDEFKHEYIGSHGRLLGDGFYFVTDKQYKNSYGKICKACYLNIVNPFTYKYFYDENKEIELLKNYLADFDVDFYKDYKAKCFNPLDIRCGVENYILHTKKEHVDFNDVLKVSGYDGVIDDKDGIVSERCAIVAFYPNQIKSITNKNPTNSSNINEDLIFEDKYVDIIADYDKINKYLHYNYEWADTPDEENYSQLIDKEGRFIHCPPSKSSFTHKLLLDDLIESGLVSMGDAYNYLNTSLFGDLGYVRCNDYDGYVQLPKDITYDQIDAISKWIDIYFLGRGYTVIDTACEETKSYNRYMFEHDEFHQADDYIKMLKRFKNSGKLVESFIKNKNKINEARLNKGEKHTMKFKFRLLENILNEDIAAVKKQYPNMADDLFMKLIAFDPTYNPNRDSVGTYGKWILNNYNKGNITDSDFGHLKDALSRFEDNKSKLIQKDIGKYKTLDELDAMLDDESSYKELSHRQEVKQRQKARRNADLDEEASLVYEDDGWEVWIPHTYAASCKLGQGASWCTASTERDYYYNYYKDNYGGEYYIIINKKRPRRKISIPF